MILLLLIGVCIFSFIAYVKEKLTLSGSIAASLIGGLVVIGFQQNGLLLLGLFFISSNVFSMITRNRNKTLEEISQKGNCRDAVQVVANGGTAAILATVYLFYPSPLIIYGFVASIAAVTADTWASELGSFSRKRPFHLLKCRSVPIGTSGAISVLGSVAAFAGSFVIVVTACLFGLVNNDNNHILFLTLIIAGFVGNLFDSLIGASFQVVYRCPTCGIETEKETHCHVKSELVYGLKWINNDMVNFGCSVVGAILGIGAGILFM